MYYNREKLSIHNFLFFFTSPCPGFNSSSLYTAHKDTQVTDWQLEHDMLRY